MWVYGDLLAVDTGLTTSPMTCFMDAPRYVVQPLPDDSQVETSPSLKSGSAARIL